MKFTVQDVLNICITENIIIFEDYEKAFWLYDGSYKEVPAELLGLTVDKLGVSRHYNPDYLMIVMYVSRKEVV